MSRVLLLHDPQLVMALSCLGWEGCLAMRLLFITKKEAKAMFRVLPEKTNNMGGEMLCNLTVPGKDHVENRVPTAIFIQQSEGSLTPFTCAFLHTGTLSHCFKLRDYAKYVVLTYSLVL